MELLTEEQQDTLLSTKGRPVKLLLQFSIPILLGNLFQQIYTLADRIIVGRFVGDTAFSAIGATNALSMMFMSMCMSAAIGTGVVVSQYFGAKDEKGTAASIANGTARTRSALIELLPAENPFWKIRSSCSKKAFSYALEMPPA